MKTASGYASTPTILVSFNGTNGNGNFPYHSHLIADLIGNLFGTTLGGGAYGYGTVFEIVKRRLEVVGLQQAHSKTADGYASTPITLVSFNGTDGLYPYAGLVADASGNLFGTTVEGGAYGVNAGYGTVFEITGSGFIPPGAFAGTPGQANCIGKSVTGLAKKYGSVLNAATALGYSTQGLQNEVVIYFGG